MNPDTTQLAIQNLKVVLDSVRVVITENNSHDFTQILALLVAVLAVFVGPFIQNRIATKQINATVLSTNRQEWINMLRNNISEFIALCLIIKDLQNRENAPSLPEKIECLNHRLSKIKLLINPTEDDHNELITLLAQATKSVDPDVLDKIEKRAQVILKREWVRVKNIE